MRDHPPVLGPGRETVEGLTEQALRWLLRGGTWAGLAREIAWQAARATGVEHGCLEWLTGLVEARLAEGVAGLEFLIDRACVGARREHLRTWPHDVGGSATAAILEGQEEAAQALGRLYVEVLDWAVGLLRDRLQCGQRAADRARLPPPRSTRPIANVGPPALIAEALAGPRARFGWPRRFPSNFLRPGSPNQLRAE